VVGPISGVVTVEADRCDGCGKCVELCPCGALELANGLVKQIGYCMACLGCMVICPKKAISVEIDKASYAIVEVRGEGQGLEKFFQKRQPSSSSESR